MDTPLRSLHVSARVVARDDPDFHAWIHEVFDNATCVFAAWAGETYAADVFAAWLLKDGTGVAFADHHGSCSGCSVVHDVGVEAWLRDVLPTKLTWFASRDTLKAHVAAFHVHGCEVHWLVNALGVFEGAVCSEKECVSGCVYFRPEPV